MWFVTVWMGRSHIKILRYCELSQVEVNIKQFLICPDLMEISSSPSPPLTPPSLEANLLSLIRRLNYSHTNCFSSACSFYLRFYVKRSKAKPKSGNNNNLFVTIPYNFKRRFRVSIASRKLRKNVFVCRLLVWMKVSWIFI